MLTKISLQAEGGAPIEFENEDQSKISCPDNCMVAFLQRVLPSSSSASRSPRKRRGHYRRRRQFWSSRARFPFPRHAFIQLREIKRRRKRRNEETVLQNDRNL